MYIIHTNIMLIIVLYRFMYLCIYNIIHLYEYNMIHKLTLMNFCQINIGVYIQKYICHSLHLCSSAACKTLPRACNDLARDLFNYFKFSSKRISQFREFQEFYNVSPHQILRPSQTRWLSLFHCLW